MSAPTVHPVVPLFRLSSSQGDVLAHGSWSFVEHEALAAGVRGGRLDILGLPGTGKTLLLQNVEQKLRKLGQIPRLLRPGDTLDRIAETDVLLVDEGESFSKDELKRIRQHPNATVMTWLPSSFRAHQAAHVVLGPLSPEDVARYIVGRLTACQRTNNLFTPEALLALAHHSGGLFRLVIILASAALFFAEQRGAAQVVLEDVDEAAAMRALVDAPEEVPVKLAPLDMLQTATAHQRPDVHRRKLWLRPATRASGGIAVSLAEGWRSSRSRSWPRLQWAPRCRGSCSSRRRSSPAPLRHPRLHRLERQMPHRSHLCTLRSCRRPCPLLCRRPR